MASPACCGWPMMVSLFEMPCTPSSSVLTSSLILVLMWSAVLRLAGGRFLILTLRSMNSAESTSNRPGQSLIRPSSAALARSTDSQDTSWRSSSWRRQEPARARIRRPASCRSARRPGTNSEARAPCGPPARAAARRRATGRARSDRTSARAAGSAPWRVLRGAIEPFRTAASLSPAPTSSASALPQILRPNSLSSMRRGHAARTDAARDQRSELSRRPRAPRRRSDRRGPARSRPA